MTDKADLGYWAISGHALLALLRRAHAGEDPDLLYTEEYANAGHEHAPTDAAHGRKWAAFYARTALDLGNIEEARTILTALLDGEWDSHTEEDMDLE